MTQSYFNEHAGQHEPILGRNGGLAISGFVAHKLTNANTPAGVTSNYVFDLAQADFVTQRQSDNGQNVVSVSMDPLTAGTTSTITIGEGAYAPCRFEVEMSLNQRVKGVLSVVELVDITDDTVPPLASSAITSIQQATTTLTVVLSTPFNGNLGDLFNVSGVPDSRLNYANCVVSSISIDKQTVQCTVSDEASLPSLTVGPFASGTFTPYWNMAGRSNGMGIRFAGTSPTSAVHVTRRAGGDVQEGGTLVGSHLSTTATTLTAYTSGGGGKVEIKSPSRYRMLIDPDAATFMDVASDTASSQWGTRTRRTAVKPGWVRKYNPRIRVVAPESIARPVAKVVSVTKTGTTTATVVTDAPHGLNTSSYVQVAGVANQTVFATNTTPAVVASVIDANTFTVVFGTATTAVSYGGAVILCNGQVTQPGLMANAINSLTRDADGIMALTGVSSWAGLFVGDYVNLYGVRDLTVGADLELDGIYEVVHLSTVTMYLRPVTDVQGIARTPSGAVLGPTSCGGAVILRTTLRINDILLAAEGQTTINIDGQGTSRGDKALPVATVNTVSVQGASAGGAAPGNPVPAGFRAATSNPTAVATATAVFGMATTLGATVNKPFSIPEADWSFTGTVTTNASTPVKAAAGTGIKGYLTAIQYQNTSAVASTLQVLRGTTVLFSVNAAANMADPTTIEFPTPLASAANEALNVQLTTTGTNTFINAQGYIAP